MKKFSLLVLKFVLVLSVSGEQKLNAMYEQSADEGFDQYIQQDRERYCKNQEKALEEQKKLYEQLDQIKNIENNKSYITRLFVFLLNKFYMDDLAGYYTAFNQYLKIMKDDREYHMSQCFKKSKELSCSTARKLEAIQSLRSRRAALWYAKKRSNVIAKTIYDLMCFMISDPMQRFTYDVVTELAKIPTPTDIFAQDNDSNLID